MLRTLYGKYIHRSFFNKLMLIYAAIAVGCILLLTEVALRSFAQTLESRELALNRQIVDRLGIYMDKRYRTALTLYQRLYAGDQTSATLAIRFFEPAGASNAERDLRTKRNLSALLADCFQADPDIGDVLVHRYSDEDWYICESTLPVLREPYRGVAGASRDFDGLRSGFVLSAAHVPQYRNTASSGRVYTMGAVVYSADLSRRLGEIYVEFFADRIREEYREYAPSLRGTLLVLTDAGDVLFDSSGKYYGAAYPYVEALIRGDTQVKLDVECVANVKRAPESNVIVAGVIPKSEIYTVSEAIRRTVYLVSLACVATTVALSYISTSFTTKRVRGITSAMKKVHGGDLSTRIPIDGAEDEMGEIATSFNDMCADLNRYIDRVYRAEIKQKSAELSALQSQINPHFLYNTLEAIRMKAILHGDEDAGEMIRLLAALFRSTVREGVITDVRGELATLDMYLTLFKIRFGDSLSATVSADEAVMDIGMVRHLLQPVVENYIVHGFESDREDNRVSITGRQEGGDIVFTVEDNGSSMPPERLAQVRETLRHEDRGHPFGLGNVNDRIRLIYGEPYGLTIQSTEGMGTSVILRIRAWNREELERHVQGIDRG